MLCEFGASAWDQGCERLNPIKPETLYYTLNRAAQDSQSTTPLVPKSGPAEKVPVSLGFRFFLKLLLEGLARF